MSSPRNTEPGDSSASKPAVMAGSAPRKRLAARFWFLIPLAAFLALADPMYCGGLLLKPEMSQGFTFRIMDMDCTEGDRIIVEGLGKIRPNGKVVPVAAGSKPTRRPDASGGKAAGQG